MMLLVIVALAVGGVPADPLGLAQAYEAQGDRAHAVYYYRQYLKESPQAKDSLLVAERLGDLLFAEAARGRGLLEIDARAHQVLVDGHSYPVPTLAILLSAGKHEVVLTFSERSERREVSIAAGKATSLSFDSRISAREALSASAGEEVATLGSGGSAGPISPSEAPTPIAAWVIIANRSVPLEIAAVRLREIFSGERVIFEDGSTSKVVLPRQGNAARAAFLAAFLNQNEASFKAGWRKSALRVSRRRPLLELASEAEVIKTVASQPGALGVVGHRSKIHGVTRIVAQ